MMKYKKQMEAVIYGLLAIGVISPIVTGIPSAVTTTFTTMIVFQIATAFAFVLWAALALNDKRYRVNWRHPIIFFFLLYVGAFAIATAFSIDPFISFWSSSYRTMGLLHLLHFAAWLVVAAGMLKSWKHWKVALILSSFVALGADIVAIVEWLQAESDVVRVHSFFGNSLYLAQFLTLHVFIAGMLWSKASKIWEWYAYILLFLIHVFGLALTVSRSAVVAIAVAFFAGAMLFVSSSSSRKTRSYAIIGLALAVVIAVGSFAYFHSRGSDWVHEHLPFTLARIVYPSPTINNDSLIEDQLADRDNLWRIAIEAFAQRPITGHGPETFRVAFHHAFDPTGRDADLIETGFDRVHNQFLEVLYGTGILGFLPYMAFWVALIALAAREVKKQSNLSERGFSTFVFMLFVAHGINLIFLFDVRSATQIFLLLCALLYWRTDAVKLPILRARKDLSEMTMKTPILVVLLAGAILLAYEANIRPFRAPYWSDRAIMESSASIGRANNLFAKAFDPKSPYVFESRLAAVNTVRTQIDFFGFRTEEMEERVAENIRQSDLSIEEFPDRFTTFQASALSRRQYASWFPESADEYLATAYDHAQKMTELAPGRVEGYEELGQIELTRGNLDEAKRWFEEARAHIGVVDEVSIGRMEFRLAEVAVREGDYEAALSKLDSANTLGYSLFYDINLIEAMNDRGDYENYPDGFTFYAAQIYTVQQNNWFILAEVAKYFNGIGDSESYNAVLNSMHKLDSLRTETLWWQQRSEVK